MKERKKATRVGNPLTVAYQRLLDLPKVFRQQVCEECGWSEATFYRYQKKPKACSRSERSTVDDIFNRVLRIYTENETQQNSQP